MFDKKGQIAIFVILAIVLAAGIALFFLIDRSPNISRGQDLDNPEAFVDKCIKDVTNDFAERVLPQGGFDNPTDYILYEGNNVAYLCKNINFYEPCISQYPLLISALKSEMEATLVPEIEQCFQLLEEELTNRNHQVSSGPTSLDVSLRPGIVELIVNKNLVLSKDGVSRNFDSFSVIFSHPLYDLAFIANEIVSQESRYCYFNNDGFMALYHDFDIRRSLSGDGSKIYTTTHKESGKKMNIAIRGCVIPAGF